MFEFLFLFWKSLVWLLTLRYQDCPENKAYYLSKVAQVLFGIVFGIVFVAGWFTAIVFALIYDPSKGGYYYYNQFIAVCPLLPGEITAIVFAVLSIFAFFWEFIMVSISIVIDSFKRLIKRIKYSS